MKKIFTLGLVMALVAIPALVAVGCGGNDNGDNAWQPNLTQVKFREQRSPSLAFYALGSGPVTHDEDEVRGHFGTQAQNAVTINNSTHTITVNTSTYATEVAVNVRNLFQFNNLTALRIRAAAVGDNAAGNWVNLRTTTNNVTTNGEHFHVYTTNDNGWVTTGNHMPAYFVVGTPAATTSRTIEVNGKHSGHDFTFFIVINRA